MKITDLQSVVIDAGGGRTWLFVEVHTDSGEIGVGEASQSRFDDGVRLLVEQWKPLFVGRQPADLIEPLAKRLLHNPFAGRVQFAAFSGIEQALWDLAGKDAGLPVHRMLGGAVTDRVPLYANIGGTPPGTNPELLVEAALSAVAAGFRAIKIYPIMKPPDAVWGSGARLSTAEFQGAIQSVATIRDAVGESIGILTDWAWTLTPGDARALADRLREYDLFWIEEPFTSGDPTALADLRSRIRPRLAGGEQLHRCRAFRPLLEARALDVIMPDVKWIGGIAEARKVVGMAEAFDVEIAPHNISGPVSCAASVQISATTRNFLMLEYGSRRAPIRAELVRGTERVEDAHLILSDAPGLGIDWDPAAARAHAV